MIHKCGHSVEWVAEHERDLTEVARLRAQNATLREAARNVTDAVREADDPKKIGNALHTLRTVLDDE